LLSGDFSSSHSRAIAARALFSLADDVLKLILPLLVSALRFEPFLCSPLAECLLLRCKSDPSLSHVLFWALVSNSDSTMPQAAKFRSLSLFFVKTKL
jgi:hypothetical protein